MHCNTHVLIFLSRHICQLRICYYCIVVARASGYGGGGGGGGDEHGDTVVVVPISDLPLHACLGGRMGTVE